MYAPTNTTELSSIMIELIELLGEMPKDCSQPRGQALTERLDALEAKAQALEAPAETLAAIQGARVLMSLAELPPLWGSPLLRTIQ